MQQPPVPPPRVHERTYRWWVLVTVVFAAFASILDSTIVNTALPTVLLAAFLRPSFGRGAQPRPADRQAPPTRAAPG